MYAMIWGNEIAPRHLDWSLLPENRDKLHEQRIYGLSVLEHCVQENDIGHVSAIASLKNSDLAGSQSSKGSIFHFYIDCVLKQNFIDIKILDSLCTNYAIFINNPDEVWKQTPLEYALSNFSFKEAFHWDIIEVFLKNGASIEKNIQTNRTPFQALAEHLFLQLPHEIIMGSPQPEHCRHEILALESLLKYAQLERAKHPSDATCYWSLDEFTKHAATFFAVFSELIKRKSLTFISTAFNTLRFSKELHKSETIKTALDNVLWSLQQKENFPKSNIPTNPDFSIISSLINAYQTFFQMFVKTDGFEECFKQSNSLNEFCYALRNYPNPDAIHYISAWMETWAPKAGRALLGK